jgi:hypothetical protein
MNWKFWESKNQSGPAAASVGTKLAKPKDLPAQIGRHLVVNAKLDPNYVWKLKCALRPRPERDHYFDFRIFDPAKARTAACQVDNYDSLNDHPDLILFKGRYDKNTHDLELDKEPPLTSAA